MATLAHYDPIKTVSVEDATQLAKFIESLLNYVYIMPADLAKVRGAR